MPVSDRRDKEPERSGGARAQRGRGGHLVGVCVCGGGDVWVGGHTPFGQAGRSRWPAHGCQDRLVADPGCELHHQSPAPRLKGARHQQRTPLHPAPRLDWLVSHSCATARPSTQLFIRSLPNPASNRLGGPCRKPGAELSASQSCSGWNFAWLPSGRPGDRDQSAPGPTSLQDGSPAGNLPLLGGMPGLAFVGRSGVWGAVAGVGGWGGVLGKLRCPRVVGA